jgi:CheY-like chemotaxis protein/predicted regulator of Ras-like GTPase activity (Roadblock/LC7/MglB family)
MPKVLVIDDSVSVRKVVERALAGRQVDVICAASGSEALECIERDAPDVIVCDVVMPDRDGYEICEFVKSHPRLGTTPVVLMSGIVNEEVRQRAARARSEGILSKPFAAEDLLKRLDGLLGALPPKEPEVAPAPVATPTLMPVSALTVEPLAASRAEPAGPKPEPAVLRPEPSTVPRPGPTVKPEPVSRFEPVVAPRPVSEFKPEPPAITSRPTVADGSLGASAGAAVPTSGAPGDGAAAILAQFTAIDGVQWAVLADREGFVVDATPDAGVDADIAGALSACLAESSDGLGRELGRGTLHGIILEYEKGIVVVYGAGAAGLLAVGLTESAVLGKVRYFARKALPELARAL